MANIEIAGSLRIVLTAPFPAIRAGLRSLCAADPKIEVLAECATPKEWPRYRERTQVFLLAPLGPLSFENWRDARECAQGTPLLVLLSQPLDFFPALEPPGWGVLPFSASADELILALRTCAVSLWVAQPALLPHGASLQSLNTATEPDEAAEPLTARETQILQFLAQGFSNKQIAQRMSISAHTVKFHIGSIYSKLGVNNRTEAARQGLRKGLITL